MEDKNNIYDSENFKLTENSYPNCDARFKEVGNVVQDIQDHAVFNDSSTSNKTILDNMAKNIEKLDKKFESLDADKQQLLFGGQFSTHQVVKDGRMINNDYNKVHVPLYLRLDIISVMLDGNFIHNSKVSEEDKEKAKEVKDQLLKLREKVAGLKYHEMFDKNKVINPGITKKDIEKNNFSFSIQNINDKEYLSINSTRKETVALDVEEDNFKGTQYTACGRHYPIIASPSLRDDFYPVIKTYSHNIEGPNIINIREELIFQEDIKKIKKEAEEERIENSKGYFKRVIEEFFPDGELPSKKELLEFEKKSNNESTFYASRHIQTIRRYMPILANPNSSTSDKINAYGFVSAQTYQLSMQKKGLEELSKLFELNKKEEALKDAKKRWKSNSIFWRVKNRKLKPSKKDLNNKSVGEIKAMLTDDVKDDDGPTK